MVTLRPMEKDTLNTIIIYHYIKLLLLSNSHIREQPILQKGNIIITKGI